MQRSRVTWRISIAAAITLSTGCSEISVREPLPPPARVSAMSGLFGSVRVEWTPVEGATDYVVQYSGTPGVEPGDADENETNEPFLLIPAPTGEDVYAVVRSRSGGRESRASPEVSAVALGDPFEPAPLWDVTGGGTFNGGRVLLADVTRDGIADVFVGELNTPFNDRGSVEVWFGALGGPSGPSGSALSTSTDSGHFGAELTVGDIDGDGFPTVVAAGNNGLTGFQRANGWIEGLEGHAEDAATTTGVALGDFDGDGYGDLARGFATAIEVQYGLDDNSVGSTTWDATDFGPGLSVVIPRFGDTEGDGFDDLLVGLPRLDGPGDAGAGQVRYYRGGADPSTSGIVAAEGFFPDQSFGSDVAFLGDVTGDGYGDWAVSDEPRNGEASSVSMFRGSASGISGPEPFLASASGSTSDLLVFAVAPAGDVDGDGIGDVLVGNANGGSGDGIVSLILGAASGLATTPVWSLPGEGSFGWSVSPARDANGDGVPDLLIGAPTDGAGRVFLHAGRPRGIRVSAGDPVHAAGSVLTPSAPTFDDNARGPHICTWTVGSAIPQVIDPCTPANVGSIELGVPGGGGATMELRLDVTHPATGRRSESVTTVTRGGS